jgi:RND family efflux transporter MFP subunit
MELGSCRRSSETDADWISFRRKALAKTGGEVESFGMRKMVVRSLAVMLIALLIVAAAALVHHRKAQLAKQPTPPSRPTAIFTKFGQWGTLAVTRHYLGTIEPEAEALLSAQTTGYITALHKDVGDRLEKGETAAEIDTRLSAAKKNALAAELAGARKDLAIKKSIWNRRRELIRNRAISQETMDDSELAASLAESRVRGLEEELSAATVSLSFSRLESLFGGVVTERMKEIGDLVTIGTPVFRMENPDRGYKILVRVPQETAASLSPKSPVRLTSRGKTLETTVDRVHPAIVSGNLATVEIRLPTRPFGLPSYGVVGVDLTVAQPEGWIVDADCLLETGIDTLVFPLAEDMTVSPVSVTVRGRSGSRAVVDGPLAAGISLAAGPESLMLTLGPGARVLPVPGDPL